MSGLSLKDLNYAQEVAEQAEKGGMTEAGTVIRWLVEEVWRLQRQEEPTT